MKNCSIKILLVIGTLVSVASVLNCLTPTTRGGGPCWNHKWVICASGFTNSYNTYDCGRKTITLSNGYSWTCLEGYETGYTGQESDTTQMECVRTKLVTSERCDPEGPIYITNIYTGKLCNGVPCP